MALNERHSDAPQIQNRQVCIRGAMNSAVPNKIAVKLASGDEAKRNWEKKTWDGPYICLYQDGCHSVVIEEKGCKRLFLFKMLNAWHEPSAALEELPISRNNFDMKINVHLDLPQYMTSTTQVLMKVGKKSMTEE